MHLPGSLQRRTTLAARLQGKEEDKPPSKKRVLQYPAYARGHPQAGKQLLLPVSSSAALSFSLQNRDAPGKLQSFASELSQILVPCPGS